jgi:hypothetical protein
VSIIFGLGAMLLGIWGLMRWQTDFLRIVRGFLPISLVFAGIIAIWAGISSLHGKK